MKIIIAPSKTMKYKKHSFLTTPLLFPEQTRYLHSLLIQYTDEELCNLMKISYKQALQVYDYYHQEQMIAPAITLYQGTVFKQLELNLYLSHTAYLEQYVRIMSAYYGILQYNTGIIPYRLDMTMKPEHINLYSYWYTPIYQYFEHEDYIISLASKEFTDMLHHPEIYFIDFIEISNQKIRRNATVIKKARGQMLNQMILQEIKTLEQLKQLNIDGYTYQQIYSQEKTLAFVRNK